MKLRNHIKDRKRALRVASSSVAATLKIESRLLPDEWQEAANRWYRYLRAESKSPATLALYKYGLEVNFLPWLSNVHSGGLGEVTRDMINNWLLALQDKGMAPASRLSYRAAVSRFFKYLADEGEIAEGANPFASGKVAQVKVPEKETALISPEAFERLKKIAARTPYLGKRNAALLDFMMETGLRVSEVSAVDLSDLDLNAGTVRVRHGKGDRFRLASIGNEAARSLDRYLTWRTKYLKGLRWASATDALWIARDGSRLDAQGIRSLIYRLGEAAGVRDLHPHSFRHASASYAALNGVDEAALRRNYGWSKNSSQPAHYTALVQTARAMQQMKAASPLDKMRR